MDKKIIICAVCPNACRVEVEIEDDAVFDVTGNGCMKGMVYASQEALNPTENKS